MSAKHIMPVPGACPVITLDRADATDPDAYATLVRFRSGTGARWGEVTAFDVRDVDLTGERGAVSITKAGKRDRGQDVLGAPKPGGTGGS